MTVETLDHYVVYREEEGKARSTKLGGILLELLFGCF